MQFQTLIGTIIGVVSERLEPGKIHHFKLVGVEPEGIWVESQEFMNLILVRMKLQSSANNVAIFLPYRHIVFAFGVTEGPALNEAAFGV